MEPSTMTPGLSAKKPGLLINRNFASLWLGQTISVFGDELFDFTLLVWIAAVLTRRPDGTSESWAPLAVSGVLVATIIPYFLLSPLAGVFVDRWDKRQTMLWMDALRTVLIVALLLMTGVVPLPFFAGGKPPLLAELGIVYTVVFLASACSQFFNPSRLALIGDLVEERYRPKASGLIQGSQASAFVVGPLLAAPLLVAFGVQWALVINALSFVASFLLIAMVHAPKAARSVAPGGQGHLVREFLAGERFAFTHRVISTLILAMCLLGLGHGGVHALYVFFTRDNLHANVTAVGVVGAVFGAGGIAGAFLWGVTAQRIGLARLFCAALLGYGLILLLTARLTSLAPGLALFFAIGLVEAAIEVAVGPLVLNAAPREMVGRVMAILSPAVRLTELVSVTLSGYLASTLLVGFQRAVLGIHLGPIDTIFTVCALLMLLGGVFAVIRLRDIQQRTREAAPAMPTETALQSASAGTDQ